jgi:hypothetical protein
MAGLSEQQVHGHHNFDRRAKMIEHAASQSFDGSADHSKNFERVSQNWWQTLRTSGKAARGLGSSWFQSARQKLGGRSRNAADLSMQFTRTRGLPWLDKQLRLLKEHTRPADLLRDYRQLLLQVHSRLLDRNLENLMFVRSAAPAALSGLKIRHLSRLSGRDYKPTPRLVFQWAINSLPEALDRFTFVDFGAGRGRVLLLASQKKFEKVVGVEFAEELHNDCEMNIAQYPRSLMKCRDVECVLDDAANFKIPYEQAVFYFFYPFDKKIMNDVLARVAESYDRNPRRLYLICVDLPNSKLVDEWGIFRPVPLKGLNSLKLTLLSPYDVTIFRTVA